MILLSFPRTHHQISFPRLVFEKKFPFPSSSGEVSSHSRVLRLGRRKMAKRARTGCDHSHIQDALSSRDRKVDVIGVITEHGLREKTVGSDWICVVKIMDESYQGYGISVNVFADQIDNLPQIRSLGDIIHFSQVMVQKTYAYYKGYAKDYIVFNKKVSGFALFEGKSGKDLIPYQASPNYGLGDAEKDCITSLRTWLLNNHITSGTNSSILPLSRVGEENTFDLVCKVLKVSEFRKDVWMLYVWDGTDAPPLLCQKKLDDQHEILLPLDLDPMPLPRNVLCGFPRVGTILRVVFGAISQDIIQLNNRWIKFIDLRCEDRAGLWCGLSSRSTRLRLLSDEDDIVMSRHRDFEERVSTNLGCVPLSARPWPSHVTKTIHNRMPFVSLMDVLACEMVTCKFKCVVRVVEILPFCVGDFCPPQEPGLYGRIMLTLEDPTARLHAFFHGEDAKMFFGGSLAEDNLICMRNKLIGVSRREDGSENLDAPRNPPWIEVCLKSYYLSKADPWVTRRYRIFGTRLVA